MKLVCNLCIYQKNFLFIWFSRFQTRSPFYIRSRIIFIYYALITYNLKTLQFINFMDFVFLLIFINLTLN